MATGVLAGRPLSNWSWMFLAQATPMYITTVRRALWAAAAKAGQSVPAFPDLAWPVTNTTPCACSRWVSGTPNEVMAAKPAVMPLTTVTVTPAARRFSTSSPPRPNTNGSPPLRRTTVSPSRTAMMVSFSMKACGVDLQPPRFPTWITRAVGEARATMAALTKSSTSNTVARWMALRALRVSSSGSPGPAPTSVQLPWAVGDEFGWVIAANLYGQTQAQCGPLARRWGWEWALGRLAPLESSVRCCERRVRVSRARRASATGSPSVPRSSRAVA